MKKKEDTTINRFFQGSVYYSTIQFLYNACSTINFNKYFSEWKKTFIEIHGELDTQRKIDIYRLETTFNVPVQEPTGDLFRLLFCLETAYSAILRMMAFKAVYKGRLYTNIIFHEACFKDKGIINYNCIWFYNWFLELPNYNPYFSALFDEIDIETFSSNGDHISELFECIFPKEIRHSLGEYYTPYWLANHVIENLTSDDKERHLKKYLDPSCGSGTFLVALIQRFKVISNNSVFHNVCGIDINPLTVLAAKTNFLLLYSEVSNFEEDLEIPIYYADTIAANDKYHSLFNTTTSYDKIPKVEYDYIVGNPPWVNWEYLPKSYRLNHGSIWQYYSLFTQKGLNANFIKEDISVLMTYVSIDNYLKDGGRLGFVIKETLFKSIKQGEGFRKFRIHPSKIDLKVIKVEDLTELKPFKGAVTRTALLYIQKGEKTNYPVDYIVWHQKTDMKDFGKVADTSMLSIYVNFENLKARPSVPNDLNSGWITESPDEMEVSKHILGSNRYVARTGVFTGGANGIFWLRIEGETSSNRVKICNITERAKNKMKSVSAEIEKDYVFPFLTGNDLSFWNYSYSKYILCPHTSKTKMYPISKEILKGLPQTEEYLLSFKKELEERKGFTSMDEQIHKDYYYTLQRIGEYTFSRYKVCWRYISKNFTPAVVEYAEDKYLGNKNIIGNEKIISIGLDDRDEAYYLCGIISSTQYRRTIENYMVGTQITPSIISKLNIPSYCRDNIMQNRISELCREGHLSKDKDIYITEIDKIVNELLYSNS